MATRSASSNARSAVFAPLEQLGRAEMVTRRLTDAITLGLLADEEQLPSESELAARLGVSTMTVREALTVLRQQGLVQTRRGRGGGSFVRAPHGQPLGGLRERLRTMTLTEIRDIGDHYVAIAGTAAKLAAERASAEEAARIDHAAGELDGVDPAAAHRAERSFHIEVAAAAQSPRLTQQEVRLQGEVGALLWLPAGDPHGRRRVRAAHAAIVAAITEADGSTARARTEEHVLDAVERLTELHLRLIES
jgi:GntR family transcriptional regulator, transcriptional repressor for pyruvate dehydrogenase complex